MTRSSLPDLGAYRAAYAAERDRVIRLGHSEALAGVAAWVAARRYLVAATDPEATTRRTDLARLEYPG